MKGEGKKSVKTDEVKKLAGIEMPDYTTDEPFELVKGVTYEGSFRIQNNGCIHVRPYKKGTKPSNLKKAIDGDNHAIFLSKKLVRIVFTFERTTDLEALKVKFRNTVQNCFVDLNDLHL
jgi:hypothetical protein